VSIVGAITAVIFAACDSIVFLTGALPFLNELAPVTEAGNTCSLPASSTPTKNWGSLALQQGGRPFRE
jgi:hypothetical protein